MFYRVSLIVEAIILAGVLLFLTSEMLHTNCDLEIILTLGWQGVATWIYYYAYFQ